MWILFSLLGLLKNVGFIIICQFLPLLVKIFFLHLTHEDGYIIKAINKKRDYSEGDDMLLIGKIILWTICKLYHMVKRKEKRRRNKGDSLKILKFCGDLIFGQDLYPGWRYDPSILSLVKILWHLHDHSSNPPFLKGGWHFRKTEEGGIGNFPQKGGIARRGGIP